MRRWGDRDGAKVDKDKDRDSRDRDREEQGQVGNSSETEENSTHSGLSCGNGVPLLPILIHNSVYREARLRCLEDEE